MEDSKIIDHIEVVELQKPTGWVGDFSVSAGDAVIQRLEGGSQLLNNISDVIVALMYSGGRRPNSPPLVPHLLHGGGSGLLLQHLAVDHEEREDNFPPTVPLCSS